MAKFKINQKVVRNSDGAIGKVKAKEVERNNKTTVIKYLVDFGGGMENWQVVTRKEISTIVNDNSGDDYQVGYYQLGDNKVLTMVANVSNVSSYDEDEFEIYKVKYKVLSIGFSIYNGTDEFDQKIGIKIAKHRCKHNPFTRMASLFSGEFPQSTVSAIMDDKAKYIIRNIDKFYRPQ
jgi:hypothetical protein